MPQFRRKLVLFVELLHLLQSLGKFLTLLQKCVAELAGSL
jgi:hypothetical protein